VTAAVALLAVVTVTGQLPSFEESDEGQLWALRQTLSAAEGAFPEGVFPAGVVFSGGVLYVTDRDNRQIIAFDADNQPYTLTTNHWAAGEADNPSSPIYGWSPNQLTTAMVDVVDEFWTPATPSTPAILVSDAAATRAYAFDTTGKFLFTISLDRPDATPVSQVAINGMALSPGGKFIFTTTSDTPTLELQGIFAASWADGWGQGPVVGAVLTYRNVKYDYTPESEFYSDPTQELIGTEGDDVDERPAKEPYGVTFDSDGNLYTVDAVTERLNAYRPLPLPGGGFDHLFTFGTSASDGTTSEFYQSYGMSYWADGPGGARLFVADAINNRVQVYRPNLTTGDEKLDYLFTIDGLGAFKNGFPFAVAIDPFSGRLAVTDDNWSPPRVWILQTRHLSAFNLQVLDADNNPIDTLCSGNNAPDYKVRFSVTVPATRPPVFNVEPQLNIKIHDGAYTEYTGQPFAPTLVLNELEVVTYEYLLTAPEDAFVGSIAFNAGATAVDADANSLSTADVLFQDAVVQVSDCPADNKAPTIAAGPVPGFAGEQLSGWTPVFQDELYTIRLLAKDDAGISRIEYDVTGANQPHYPHVDPVEFDGSQIEEYVDVPLMEMGETTITFKTWDSNQIDTDGEPLNLTLVSVPDLRNNEGDFVPPFTVGPLTPGLTYSETGLPAGLMFNTATGVISGTVAHNAAREYDVTITESNGDPETATSVTFHWSITNINLAPIANNDSYSTNEDTALTVTAPGVLGNDTNEDSAPLTATLVSGPSNGTLTLDPDGSFLYTPAGNFHGSDSFTYKANDGAADSNEAVVTIVVNSVNDPPTAADDAATTVEDGGLLTIDVLANDSDVEGPLVVTGVTQPPAGGVAAFTPTSVTFTPAPNFSGTATFTYAVSDSDGAAAGATVTVTVDPANDLPVANNDSFSTNEDTPLTVLAPGVLANDTDADGDSLTAIQVTGPAHGTLALNADGSFVYTPAANYSGNDSFTYKANDGTGDSVLAATVTITVHAVNDPPTAEDDAGTMNEDGAPLTINVLANDSDVEGALTVTAVTQPASGVVTFTPTTVTFTPAPNFFGLATFTYTVTDSNGAKDTATVRVTVNPVNDPPVAVNDSYSTGEDTVLTVPAPGVLGNDTDVDSTVTASVVTGPLHGTLTLNSNGSFVYTPAADFYGTDSFVYKASDGELSANATATITVVPSNLPPVCNAAVTPTIVWPPNHKPVYFSVSGIADPEGGALNVSYTILQDEPTDGPGQGNTKQDGGVDANGRVWVRAERSGTGDGRVYLVSYTATDAFLASCTGVFTVSVPHDQSGAPAVLSPGRWNSMTGQQVSGFLPPNAVNDAVTVKKGQAQTIAVLSNDIANGQPLTVAIVTPPTIGVATLNPNGTITYQPPPGVTGTTSFTYQVTTPSGGTDTATVAVTLKK
jgi:VCBS repeat-containing protein